MSRSPRAILLVDHGSTLEEANAVLDEIAAHLRRLAPQYHVEVAHMELAHPTIEEGIQACVEAGAVEIVVHPYMLGPGRHATRDIPELVREAARAYPQVRILVSEPLGPDARLAEVILARVEAAAGKRPESADPGATAASKDMP